MRTRSLVLVAMSLPLVDLHLPYQQASAGELVDIPGEEHGYGWKS
jgi:hypothetical protein